MTTPAFNPNHHPILDLPPHEFVRRANEAGIKLAEGVGYFDADRKCGCASGVAEVLVAPHSDKHRYSIPAVRLRLKGLEGGGILFGFDNSRFQNDHPEFAAGHAWGSAVRAAALEIQGDLEPTPLKGKQVKS